MNNGEKLMTRWKNIFETKKFNTFQHRKDQINNFEAADDDDSIRVAVTRHPFTRLRSAWRDKSRKYMLENGVVNVELFRKWGRKGDGFSEFFEKGQDPYSKEAREKFWGHAKHCEDFFGQYSKEKIGKA